MDDLTLLKDRIAQLVAGPPPQTAQGRPLTGPPAAALAAEIAETQLPRTLTFHNDRGETLALAIRAGRILMLAGPGSAHTVLTDGDTAAVDMLMSAVTGFLAGAAALWVQSAYLTTPVEDAETGIALPDLDIAPPPVAAPTGLAGFVEGCGDIAEAVLWVDGATDLHRRGTPDALAVLEALASAELQSRAGQPGDDTPRCMILGGPVAGGRAILCGSLGASLALAVHDAAHTGQMVAIWQAQTGSGV